jgi:flagellar biosynthesis protein FliQ
VESIFDIVQAPIKTLVAFAAPQIIPLVVDCVKVAPLLATPDINEV